MITEALLFRCTHTLCICALRHVSVLFCLIFMLLHVSPSGVAERQRRQSNDTELIGVQEGGHRAQLNLWTKRCSLLMTQWDLPVRAWSMPAAVSADAQLTGTTLRPRQHKGSPASTFYQLGLFTSKASLFTATPDASRG